MNDKTKEAGKPATYQFDALNLQIGTRMQIVLKNRTAAPGVATQYYTTLIGYVRDEYVIVKSPQEKGAFVHLREGEQIELRTFTGSLLLACTAVVQRLFPTPHNYMHLSFPRFVETTLLRKAVRVRTDMEAQLTCIAQGQGDASSAPAPTAVFIRDVSVDGAQIEAGVELGDKGSAVKLAFSFRAQPTDENIRIEANAVIKAVRPVKPGEDGAAPVHRYGIEFVGLGSNNQVLLQNLVYQVLIDNRENIV
jgi:hypothetical protein